jgi:putative tryptophan/tyrosine transport system substrate-binding protein
MKRREFIAGLGAAAWPAVARAQQALPVMGSLTVGAPETTSPFIAAAFRGLAEAGYVEGQNLIVERRWSGFQLDRLPELAADLVRRKVAVIAAGPDAAVQAAKSATQTIPIVFLSGNDPVEMGFVASLNRPGGNVTGISTRQVEVAAKQLELLTQTVPTAKSIAVLQPPSSVAGQKLQAAANVLGVRLLFPHTTEPSDFEGAFAALVREGAGALLVGGYPLYFQNGDRIVALAARYGVPAMYPNRGHAVAGGLMSYSTDFTDAGRQMGVYVGRILKGEKPADLPVQQATKMELVINLKTANALGVTFPPTLLGRADEVIE